MGGSGPVLRWIHVAQVFVYLPGVVVGWVLHWWSVGGRAIRVCSNELPARVNSVDVFQEAQRVANFVPEYGELAAIWDSQADPHEAENVDFCLAPGLFGVAENGAIWTPTDQIAPRSALFLCQHLGLVVPAADIVDNMHQAYERIEFGEGGFGVFISGPSKTADIEQSLVIGAHGPRSLVVFLTT